MYTFFKVFSSILVKQSCKVVKNLVIPGSKPTSGRDNSSIGIDARAGGAGGGSAVPPKKTPEK